MDEQTGREKPREAAWAERELQVTPAQRRAVLDGLMTADEHRAMELTAELFGILERASRGGDRDVHDADVAEVAGLVHGLQNLILAQAAARAFPDRYRLLGRRLERDVEARMGAIRLERVRHAEADAERREQPNGDYWTRREPPPEWPTCGCDPTLVDRRSSPWTCPHGVTWRLGVEGDPDCWTPVGVTELDPERELRLPRYWTGGVFRWRDVLLCPAEPGDHGTIGYYACPADGPHDAHRWALCHTDRPDEVPAHAWRLCDPKPGLTGDSHGDLERIAAWSRRHRDAATALSCVYPGCTDRRDPRWHNHGAPADDPSLPIEERLAAALAGCATELDEADIANVVAAVVPVFVNPYRRDPEARR